MATQHKDTPDADLHEIKGAAAATAGKVPIASGAGTSPFGYLNPAGTTYFINYAAPYTIVYPAAYTLVSPVTIAGGVAIEVTEGLAGRLTYTGTMTSKFRVVCNATVSQAAGANRDIGLKVYKNGVAVASSEIFTTASTGFLQLITTVGDVSLATNDYIEAYVVNLGVGGDVRFHSYWLNILGVRG